jgi:hypothetical protein
VAVERGPSEGARSGSKESSSRPCVSPSKLAGLLQEDDLFGLLLRAIFSLAHPLAHRNVPLAQARAFQFSLQLSKGVARLPSTARIGRAHSDRARSASKEGTWLLLLILRRPRVARAQETNRLPSHTPSELGHLLSTGWPGRSSNARVERAPSERARSASRRTTRLPCLPSIRKTSSLPP